MNHRAHPAMEKEQRRFARVEVRTKQECIFQ